jgi:hypothetical protein
MDGKLVLLAALIRERNTVTEKIAQLIGRPAQIGHLGEFIASRIFDITLLQSASAKGIDGRFNGGALQGRSVNVKWYTQQENILDITPDMLPDFYLVLTGPKSRSASSRGVSRPWVIEAVYLYEAKELIDQLQNRDVKLGVASSVRQEHWYRAEINPNQQNRKLVLTEDQIKLLDLSRQA